MSHMTQVIDGPVTAEYQESKTASSRRGSTNCKLHTHQAMHDSARYKCVRSLRRDHQNSRKNTPMAERVTLHATGMTNCKNSRIARRCARVLAGPTLIWANAWPT